LSRERSNGAWPLEVAARSGHVEVVRILVEHKADVQHRRTDGAGALKIAAGYGKTDVVRFLIQDARLTPTPSVLSIAIRNGRLDVVRFLIEECLMNGHLPDHRGRRPLMRASQKGHLHILKYLLRSCPVDVNEVTAAGISPVATAAFHGHRDVIDCLVTDWGADLNLAAHQTSPLGLAVRQYRSLRRSTAQSSSFPHPKVYLEVIQLLVKLGSQITPKCGCTKYDSDSVYRATQRGLVDRDLPLFEVVLSSALPEVPLVLCVLVGEYLVPSVMDDMARCERAKKAKKSPMGVKCLVM
jgi:hypothetical protein